MTITDCLIECEIAESKAEASRLLQQHAIKVDNRTVDKKFTFRAQVSATDWRELDVQSIESYEWEDWYDRFLAGELRDDIPFRTLGRIVELVGAKGFSRQDLALNSGGTLLNMILGETFLISRGKTDYWVVRLSETGLEINERMMQISLDAREQVMYDLVT